MTIYDGLWRYYTAFTLFLSYITKYDVFKSLNDASLVYSPDFLQFATHFSKYNDWKQGFSKIMWFWIEFSIKLYFTIGLWSIRSCSSIRSWLGINDHSRKVYDHSLEINDTLFESITALNLLSDPCQNRILFEKWS